jgi:hypothetical protein
VKGFILLAALLPLLAVGCQSAIGKQFVSGFEDGAKAQIVEGVTDALNRTPIQSAPTSGGTIWYALGAGIASALALAGENAIKAKWGGKGDGKPS